MGPAREFILGDPVFGGSPHFHEFYLLGRVVGMQKRVIHGLQEKEPVQQNHILGISSAYLGK